MAKTGLSYYQADTDRFQDIKVKRLKKRYGCEGYAVFQYIQNEIYRVEGCYIRFTDDQLFDVSEYWCIDEDRVEAIIEYCAEVELFDAITWRTKRVLTSVDIQQRYIDICRRAKKKILIPEDILLIELQDAPAVSGTNPNPLPLFTGQQIDTKTGETHYGVPKLLNTDETATGKHLPADNSVPPEATDQPQTAQSAPPNRKQIPRNSAEKPDIPRNSAGNGNKTNKSKVNSSSIPQTIPRTSEEEEHASPFSSPGKDHIGESSPDEYRLKLEHLLSVCRSMGCAQNDWRQIQMLKGIAEADSPIWGLMEEVRHSGGRYSFNQHVLQSLRALVISGRLEVMQATPEAALSDGEMRRLLMGIGVASYEIEDICAAATGKEQALKEAIDAVRRSKGKILMPGIFIRSRLKNAEEQKRRKTA